MIEITKDQCTRMLVWDSDEDRAEGRYVVFEGDGLYYAIAAEYESLFEGGATLVRTDHWDHAKPLPEEKPMTALDVMWWAGTRIVARHKSDTEFYSIKDIDSDDDIKSKVWNELIRKDGKTVLLYDEWKEFTFANCDMGEG